MKIVKMAYEAGVTVEIKDTYFKETYREEIELHEKDDPEKERDALIDRVHERIDSEIVEIRKANK